MTKKKWTAKNPGVESWDRIRIYVDPNDPRPVIWPPLGPYWVSGSNDTHSVVVAYVPHGTLDVDILKYWPEANNEGIDRMHTDTQLTYSDRFQKPSWWKD